MQLPSQADALLFIHPSNYSLRNLKFEDTKDRPYLSLSAIDLIERRCGCREKPNITHAIKFHTALFTRGIDRFL